MAETDGRKQLQYIIKVTSCNVDFRTPQQAPNTHKAQKQPPDVCGQTTEMVPLKSSLVKQ